ncbi:unnamed protein product [Prorocentrum cordatum]|uniref:Uncharacterized protein n=1 Tax=Prorocentrum cordatum TaxID=2364126 RepID=A0ABN9RG82_9DINO|nr:unnamed protein product [Polarella glacialis]
MAASLSIASSLCRPPAAGSSLVDHVRKVSIGLETMGPLTAPHVGIIAAAQAICEADDGLEGELAALVEAASAEGDEAGGAQGDGAKGRKRKSSGAAPSRASRAKCA